MWPLPSPDELAPYYAFDRYIVRSYARENSPLETRLKTFEGLLEEVQRTRGGPGTLLDIGCSVGHMLQAGLALGWKVKGIEIDPTTARLAATRLGASVSIGAGLDAVRADEQFDLIVMSHWLEHTTDPRKELLAAAAHLSGDGLILIRVPNARSVVAELMGSAWRYFSPPGHLFYFCRVSFDRLLPAWGLSAVWTRECQGEGHSLPFELIFAMGRRFSPRFRPSDQRVVLQDSSKVRRDKLGSVTMRVTDILEHVVPAWLVPRWGGDSELQLLLRRSGPS